MLRKNVSFLITKPVSSLLWGRAWPTFKRERVSKTYMNNKTKPSQKTENFLKKAKKISNTDTHKEKIMKFVRNKFGKYIPYYFD